MEKCITGCLKKDIVMFKDILGISFEGISYLTLLPVEVVEFSYKESKSA